MWYLLDTLSRPSLARHLQSCAAVRYGEAATLLSQGLDPAARSRLLAALEGGAAAVWLLRSELSKPRRSDLQQVLRRQRRLAARLQCAGSSLLPGLRRHAGSRGDARTLERLAGAVARIESRAAAPDWRRRERRALRALLDGQQAVLQGGVPPSGALELALREGLTGLYRRTGRSFQRDPRSGRAWRRLGRLVRLEELLGFTRGPNADAVRQRGLLHEGMREDRLLQRWLEAPPALESSRDARRVRRLLVNRRAELAGWLRDLQRSALAASPQNYGAELPWQVFRGLGGGGSEWLISGWGAV